MAVEALSASHDAWNTQYAHYLSLTQQLEQAPPHERDALERARADAQDDLMALPAPSLTAVLHKLEIRWEDQLSAEDERRLILDDLADLIQAQTALPGA
ncbi:hypothetical protein J2Y54_001282 [Sphingomonas sp. BE123]|uniref:hypothetical protein n=1 Tax=Sphingomonas sp. BE123 TaxID=2817842 RepID=UPI0028646D91|nr:hypothetical protein [Sphingomonas sp. BE123]MDR6851789.1 hypothetical protein [Sphingomonas sp. BE123]